MTNYSYLIMNPAGKEVKGTLKAETKEQAVQQLKQEGNTVLRLEEASALSKDITIPGTEKKPKDRDMAVFCRQFVSIINAGVSVTVALGMLADQTENKMLAAALSDCKEQIEMGSSLSEAMDHYPKIFNHMFVTLVAAGEASGSLDVSFTRMGTQFEKDSKLKGMIKKASTYPMVVMVVAVLVIGVMLGYVVPQFEDMLQSLGTDLPLLTKVVVAASHYVVDRWYIVLAVIVALVLGIRYFKRTEGGGLFFGRLALKAPLIGKLTVKNASARLARTLSTLLGAGLPMLEALEIAAGTMNNIHFHNAVLEAKDDVAMGENLSVSIERSGLFPPLVHHMLGIGEETGDIEEMLEKLAGYYEEEVELTTQQVMTAVEPLIILVLALVVGAVVGAVMLPMVEMYSALENI